MHCNEDYESRVRIYLMGEKETRDRQADEEVIRRIGWRIARYYQHVTHARHKTIAA